MGWEEFFLTNPYPIDFESWKTAIKNFCEEHKGRKVVLISVG